MLKYDEEKVIRQLNQKNDIIIPRSGHKKIYVLVGARARRDIGKNSRGKIDYLVNHLGYQRIEVTEF